MNAFARIVPVIALSLAFASSARADCPAYGCEATITPLTSHGYVVQGSAVFAVFESFGTCPTPAYWFIYVDGRPVQKIPASWVKRDYLWECPSDWQGTFADLVGFDLEPGKQISLVLGEERVCSVELVVPEIPAAGSPCDGRDGEAQ